MAQSTRDESPTWIMENRAIENHWFPRRFRFTRVSPRIDYARLVHVFRDPLDSRGRKSLPLPSGASSIPRVRSSALIPPRHARRWRLVIVVARAETRAYEARGSRVLSIRVADACARFLSLEYLPGLPGRILGAVLRRRPCCLLPRRAETEASITSRRRGCGACALASRARRRRVPLLRALSRSFPSLFLSRWFLLARTINRLLFIFSSRTLPGRWVETFSRSRFFKYLFPSQLLQTFRKCF